MSDFSNQKPLFVEIANEAIEPARPFTDKSTGMAKTIPGRQNAYVHSGAAYPIRISLDVDADRGPLRPGRYLLGGDCFVAGQYQRPEFNARKLVLVDLETAVALLQPVEGGKLKVAS